MKHQRYASWISLALVLAGGCQQQDPAPEGLALPLEKSSEPRVTRSKLPSKDAKALRRGNLDLSFKILNALGDSSTNAVVSGVSLQSALGMAHLMARGKTQESIAKAAHFPEEPKKVYAALSYLDQELASRNVPDTEDKRGQTIKVTNQAVLNKDLQPNSDFLDTLASNFGTGVYKADFKNNSEELLDELNDWIAKRTENKIRKLLSEDQVNSSTRWVLLNALYFKSPWAFEMSSPKAAPFHLPNGDKVEVPTLRKYGLSTAYGKNDDYQWASLPLRENELALMVILPRAGQFDSSRSKLSAALIEEMREQMKSKDIELSIPKLDIDTGSTNLLPALRELGLKTASSASEADFGAFTDQKEVDTGYIDAVVQQVVFGIDKHGIEAAAATASVGTQKGDASDADKPIEFFVDRPFYFVLQDQETGVGLFVGQVVDPRKEK